MANSSTKIATTKDISTTAVVALAGPTRIIVSKAGANAILPGEEVRLYSEQPTADNSDGTYEPVPEGHGRLTHVDYDINEILFEGYGNYKLLIMGASNADLVVGYVAG